MAAAFRPPSFICPDCVPRLLRLGSCALGTPATCRRPSNKAGRRASCADWRCPPQSTRTSDRIARTVDRQGSAKTPARATTRVRRQVCAAPPAFRAGRWWPAASVSEATGRNGGHRSVGTGRPAPRQERRRQPDAGSSPAAGRRARSPRSRPPRTANPSGRGHGRDGHFPSATKCWPRYTRSRSTTA